MYSMVPFEEGEVRAGWGGCRDWEHVYSIFIIPHYGSTVCKFAYLLGFIAIPKSVLMALLQSFVDCRCPYAEWQKIWVTWHIPSFPAKVKQGDSDFLFHFSYCKQMSFSLFMPWFSHSCFLLVTWCLKLPPSIVLSAIYRVLSSRRPYCALTRKSTLDKLHSGMS